MEATRADRPQLPSTSSLRVWGPLIGPFCLLTFPLLVFFAGRQATDPRWGPFGMVGRNTSLPLVGVAIGCLLVGLVSSSLCLVFHRRLRGLPLWIWAVTLFAPLPAAWSAVQVAGIAHAAKLRRNQQGPYLPDVPPQAVPAEVHAKLLAGDILPMVMWADPTAHHAWVPNAWRQGSTFRLAMEGRMGGDLSLAIQSAEPNDSRWVQRVGVQPHTRYRLTGWIRTEEVRPSAEPAQLGAHLALLDRPEHSAPLFGDQDWTQATLDFESGEDTSVVVACRLGTYGGTVQGKAWFDDLQLTVLP